MDVFYGAFLGFLQGATEFLPISSSAHLALAGYFFQVEQAGLTFDVALHLGTLLAILCYFRQDFMAMVRGLLARGTWQEIAEQRRRILFITLATMPAVGAGLVFGHAAETVFRSPLIIAFTLSAAGLLLWFADKWGKKDRDYTSITLKDAFIIGCAQALALIPGVSRSGSTMTAALFLGLSRPAAALFSFLLSAPVVFGAGIYNIPKVMDQSFAPGQVAFYLTGVGVAAVSGYLFIAFLMRFVRTRSLALFAYYRFLLSALVVLALALGY